MRRAGTKRVNPDRGKVEAETTASAVDVKVLSNKRTSELDRFAMSRSFEGAMSR